MPHVNIPNGIFKTGFTLTIKNIPNDIVAYGPNLYRAKIETIMELENVIIT